jgi:hypothetical protein
MNEPNPKLEWRKQVFPEVLKTIVEHDSIMRSWIRFLIGIEGAAILAIWALASSNSLSKLAFCCLVIIIGFFGSWMALQLIGIIGRVRQWNDWFIEVARDMQKDGEVQIFPLSDGQQPTATEASLKHPVKFLIKLILEKAICAHLWLLTGLRSVTDPHSTTEPAKTAAAPANVGELKIKSTSDTLPSPDKSVIFRLLLVGNTVFLVSLWTAIIVLCFTYKKTESLPLRVELAPSSVTNVVQLLSLIGQANVSNNILIHKSIENLASGFQSNSNVIQSQIAEIRQDFTNRTDGLLGSFSNRTEFLLHALTSRIDSVLANHLSKTNAGPNIPPVPGQPKP